MDLLVVAALIVNHW